MTVVLIAWSSPVLCRPLQRLPFRKTCKFCDESCSSTYGPNACRGSRSRKRALLLYVLRRIRGVSNLRESAAANLCPQLAPGESVVGSTPRGTACGCSALLFAEWAFRLQPLILSLRQMETGPNAGLKSTEILVLLLFAADSRAEHIAGASVHRIVPDDHTAIRRTCPTHSEEQEL